MLDNTNEHIYIPVWCDLNFISNDKCYRCDGIYIPVWCDLNGIDEKKFVKIISNLHSSMVRFESDDTLKIEELKALFTFQYGAI